MKKNDEFEIYITDLSDDGAGVGRAAAPGGAPSSAFTWFVKDAVIGDRVLAAATKVKKHYGFARVVRVLEASPDRVQPPCPEARRCGGCQIQQLSYDAQLEFKENKIRNDLLRIGGFSEQEIHMEPIIRMETPFRYRNKTVYPIGTDREERLIAGFYAGRTHSIIPCEDCLLGQKENGRVLRTILRFMEEKKIPAYDEAAHTGLVRHVLIRSGRRTGEWMVCIVINGDRLPFAEELCSRLKEELPGLRSFSLNINKERTNVIMGTGLVHLLGPGYIEDEIREITGEIDIVSGQAESCGDGAFSSSVRFRISPLSFFQVNPEQMERLYSTALEFAGLKGEEKVWDLYCGVGTITLFLAGHAKKVFGVEIIPAAIENAKENAVLNHIDNAEFFVGRAEEVLPAWHETHPEEGIDVMVVDPPRKGCDSRCLETMVQMAPSRIVYVSCDPATLARDLRYLCDHGYQIERVKPCDMFSQTVHIETIVLLQRQNS